MTLYSGSEIHTLLGIICFPHLVTKLKKDLTLHSPNWSSFCITVYTQ